MNARFPHVLPFAVLAALAVGCSSSSSPETSGDAGPKDDTGTIITHHEGGKGDTGSTSKKDTGTTTPDTGSTTPDTGIVTVDAGPVTVTPAPNSTMIASGVVQVLGMTDQDNIVFYDSKGGISVADITGKVTQIAPGPTTDGGAGPTLTNIGGHFVAFLTNYSTHTVTQDGQTFTAAYKGTLFLWSTALVTPVQIATDANGLVGIALDSSYVAYMDGSDTSGNVGNIGVATGAGTGSVDLVTNVVIDQSSTTCAPLVSFDGGYAVVSTCAVSDAGHDELPSVSSFNSAGTPIWSQTVLAATAGPNNLSAAPEAINFTTDTSGTNVLTVGSGTPSVLSIQGLGGTTETTVAPSIGAVAGGTEFFYLAADSSYALYTTPTGSLGKATFTAGSTTPTTNALLVDATEAGVGGLFGVEAVSTDGNYEIDYNTATDPLTGAPSSLNLRSLSTGSLITALVPSGTTIASTFGAASAFTADGTFVIFTADLTQVGSVQASVGSLETAPVAGGPVLTLVPSSGKVWDATPLLTTKLIYNQNYNAITMFSNVPNGSATADVYIADATVASPGGTTPFITGADAPDGFYVTQNKMNLFYSFTQLVVGDSGNGVPVPGDGLYVVALPQ